MAELPFQQPQTLNTRQNRSLALAAVFQSTQLTHMTAMAGQHSIGESGNFYLEQLIKASLNIRPSANQSCQTLDFFNQLSDLSLGLKTLEDSINQPFNPSPKSRLPKLSNTKLPMSYAMALLQLEKNCLFLIITIYIPVLLPILRKPMSILPDKLIHVLWSKATRKRLKMPRTPIVFALRYLPVYKWRIYGVKWVVAHGV